MTKPTTFGERVGYAAAWNVLALGVLSLFTFASGILLARMLSKEEYACYAFVVATIPTLMSLLDLGLSLSVPKFAAEAIQRRGARGLRRTLRLVVSLKFLLFAIVMAAYLLSPGGTRRLFGLQATAPALLPLAVLAVVALDLLADLFQQGLATCIAQGAIQVVRISESLVLSGMILTLVPAGYGIPGVLAAFLASSAAKVVLSFGLLVREMRLMPPGTGEAGPAGSLLPRLLRHSTAIWGIKVTSLLTAPAYATLVLGRTAGPVAVANFSAASELVFRITELVMTPVQNLLHSIFASFAAREAPDAARRAFVMLTRFHACVLLPTAAGLFALAPHLLPVMYSSRFVDSVPAFRWLIVAVALDYLFTPVALSALITAERYRYVLATRIPMVLVGLTLPAAVRAGGPLAAVALLCGGRVVASWLLAATARRCLGVSLELGFILRQVAIAGGLGLLLHLAVRALTPSAIECALLIVAFAIAFWALFKLTGGIGREQRERIAGMRLPLKMWIVRLV